MIENERTFSKMQLDALAEIGNIGASTAATSLSQMLALPIEVAVPRVEMLSPDAAALALGGYEKVVAGLLFSFTGDLCGMMVFLIGEEFACSAIGTLMGGLQYDDLKVVGEIERSALSEIGNIMAASYLRALSQVIGCELDLSTPCLCIDMLGAVLNAPAVMFAHVSDELLLIEGNFRLSDTQTPCNLLLMPDVSGMDQMMEKLGLVK